MQTIASPTLPLGALRDDGSVDPAHAGVLSDELGIALYEHMVLARAVDERLVALQRDGPIASHAPPGADPPPPIRRSGSRHACAAPPRSWGRRSPTRSASRGPRR